MIGVVVILIGIWAWGSNTAAGVLICAGAFAKTISAVIGAAAKAKKYEGMKSWVEERLGYLDAFAALAAFPALFAVGGELLLGTLSGTP